MSSDTSIGKRRRSRSWLTAILGVITLVMTTSLTAGIATTASADSSTLTWQRQEVQALMPGWYSSLVLDGQGRPHVAYRSSPSNSSPIQYAYYDGTAWRGMASDTAPDDVSAAVELGGSTTGYFMTVALDPATGHPRIAFTTGTVVRYAAWDGATWKLSSLPAATHTIAGLSMVLDATGTAHVSYIVASSGGDSRGGMGVVYYATNTGGVWTAPQQVSEPLRVAYGYTAIALSGGPHIAYYDNYSKTVRYASLDSDVWSSRSVYITGTTTVGNGLALDFYEGEARIAFSVNGGLRIASSANGLVWTTSAALANVVSGITGTLALEVDPSGVNQIAYTASYAGKQTVWLGSWNGTTWTAAPISAPHLADYYPDLALDGGGRPRVTYFDRVTGTTGPLVYLHLSQMTAEDDALAVDEDTEGSVDVLANDMQYGFSGPLTVSVTVPPQHGSAYVNGDQIAYLPGADYNGPDGLTYKVCDANGAPEVCATATVSITVNAVNDTPVFGTFPAKAGGQYTDPLDGDTGTAGIQSVTLSATDVDDTDLSFSVDASACEGGQDLPGNLALSDNGDGTATIAGRINVKAGAYTPCIVVSDGETSVGKLLTLTVTPEDATVVGIEPDYVEVDGDDHDADVTTLKGTFVEVKDGYLSTTLSTNGTAYNETDVKLSLSPVGTAGSTGESCTEVGVPLDGKITCAVSDLLSDVYEITASSTGGWFEANGIAALAVYDPANGSATGGGHVTWYGPSPWDDARVNFGFTGKKLLKKMQGSILTVIHAEAGPYVVKSNAFSGFAVNQNMDGVWYTTMAGKATYGVPEGQVNPYCDPGVLKCGNFTATIYAEDRAEPGAGVDTYRMKLVAPDRKTVVFDMPLSVIDGGNVQIPHAATN